MRKNLLSLIFLALFILFALGSTEEDPEEKAHREKFGDELGAWVIAQEFVNDRLKSPGTADYGWQTTDECVTDLGRGRYAVKGWVDSQNSFGGTVRIHFSLTVKYLGNDKWQLEDEPVMVQR